MVCSPAAALRILLNVLQGNAPSGMPPAQDPPQGPKQDKGDKDKKAEPPKKKWEPPLPTRVGKKKRRGPATASKLPPVFPATRCRLRLLKMDRIKDYMLLEEEFIHNQERLKPESSREEKNQDERSKVDDIRGTPMMVGTLEEIIDDDHAIISTASGPESYVSIMSFVDKDRIEPGCSVLLNHKNQAVVGVLEDDTDPLVSVMKLDKAPTESYADIGGLENQIQEIKVIFILFIFPSVTVTFPSGIRRTPTDTSRVVRRNGNQTSQGRHSLRCPRNRENATCQSSRKPNVSNVLAGGRLRAHPEIPWRWSQACS